MVRGIIGKGRVFISLFCLSIFLGCTLDIDRSYRVLKGHDFAVWSVRFSPDGKLLASGSMDNTVILWNTATWEKSGS